MASDPESEDELAKHFSEEEYLRANPDVLRAIASGEFASGWDHFLSHGRAEGRRYTQVVEVRLTPSDTAQELELMPRCTLENVFVSLSGGVFVIGWIDDTFAHLSAISIECAGSPAIVIRASQVARVRRADVEEALSANRAFSYGFWTFVSTATPLASGIYRVTLHVASGGRQTFSVQARGFADEQLRDTVLAHFSAARYFGNPHVEGIISLGDELGRELVNFNRTISRRLYSSPYVESFGKNVKRVKGTIIVCLYGRPEYLFLQNALYSGLPGIEDYEFVYVCNSPELAERLLADARIGNSIYRLDQTLVLLSGNAGFGAANNVAARYARSNRFLFVNPDVFPRDADWAKKHTDVVSGRPARETNVFGLPLYYDDGSLMHGGMYFDVDSVSSMGPGGIRGRDFIRVEHFGKGAPPGTLMYRQARQVPAISGAFMSIDRRAFEKVSGFTEDFIFGHYEDADFCLKALAEGIETWIHDVGMWHLEGKGSYRLPIHEGGSLVNRWLFTERWGSLIKDQLKGPSPRFPEQEVVGAAGPSPSDVPNATKPGRTRDSAPSKARR